jgi:uncharacterized protein (TIGR02118 family)
VASTITVLYENVDDATFDLDYYMAKHMPMVGEKFKPFGIKGWRVLKGVGTPTGEKPRYSIIATLEFDTGQQFKDAVAAEGETVFGDVPNFSNKHPIVVIGDVVGSSP